VINGHNIFQWSYAYENMRQNGFLKMNRAINAIEKVNRMTALMINHKRSLGSLKK
jgi:hypothetical protein